MGKQGTVYAVYDLEDGEKVRYVGATIRKLKYREREHVKSSEGSSQTPIARAIRKWGQVTLIPLLEGVPSEDLGLYEKAYIQVFKSVGQADLNLLVGGYKADDYLQFRKTEGQKKRQSEISKGHWANPDWAERQRSKIAASLKTPEYRQGARERALSRIENGNFSLGGRKGSESPRAKLDEETVLAIREEYALGGVFYRELAVKYGVTESCIHLVIKRKSWTHV